MKSLIEKLRADWSSDQPERALSRSTVVIMFLGILVLMLPPVFLMTFPARDVAMRYAPMADAFAAGNFEYAFHPRIPMLHPLLAGCVAFLTGCGGFLACRIVSALFFAAGVVPLTALMRRVFDRKMAMIAAIIYGCASPLMQLGYSGLRDSAKGFLLLVMAYALVRIYQEREQWGGYVLCGISCGLAFLVRVDLIILAAVLLWGIFFLECRCNRGAVRSWVAGALAVLCAAPAFIQNYLQIGIAVPDSYSADQIVRFAGRNISVIEVGWCGIAAAAAVYTSALLLSLLKRKYLLWFALMVVVVAAAGVVFWFSRNTFIWKDAYWSDVFRGSFAYYWIMVFPGIAIRLYRKEWRREESLLILFFILHLVVVMAQFILFKKRFYVSNRYLESVLPLLFGWAAYFAVKVWELLDFTQKKWLYPRWWMRTAAAILIAVPIMIYLIFAYIPVVELLGQGQKKRTLIELHRIADTIRANGVDKGHPDSAIKPGRYVPACKTGMTCWDFRDGKWRCNRGSEAVVSYFAGVKLVKKGDYVLYSWKKSAPPPRRLPFRKGKMLLKTGDGKREYQLWSVR